MHKPTFNLSRNGFTLIELLVVIAIIGLLASIMTTALSSARLKARDARRLSDIKQVKSGLDLYFSTANGYPATASFNAAYAAQTTLNCGTTTILRVPQDPLYPSYSYTYIATGGPVSGCGEADLGLSYTLTFILEKTGTTYTMNQDGDISPALPY